MEKSITKIMEDPYNKRLGKEEKNKATANDLKMLRLELDNVERYLTFSLNGCKKLDSGYVDNLENVVGMIRNEIEETKEQLDKKLKYWNRFATI